MRRTSGSGNFYGIAMGRRDRTIILTITVAVLLVLHIYLSDDEYPPADAPIDPRRSLRINDPKTLTSKITPAPWTKEEHELFLRGLAHFATPGRKTWDAIAREFVATRSGDEVQDHWREYAPNRGDPDYLPYAPDSEELQTELADEEEIDAGDGAAMNKGPWTAEEHEMFLWGLAYFGNPGRKTWDGIASRFVATRSGEEVQAHWSEYAANREDPPYAPSSPELQTELADKGPIDANDGAAMKKGPWTKDEHDLFLQGLTHFGNPSIMTWEAIARKFVVTRSGEEVRDHWREYAPNRDDPDYLPYAPSSPELQTELADEEGVDASDGAVMK